MFSSNFLSDFVVVAKSWLKKGPKPENFFKPNLTFFFKPNLTHIAISGENPGSKFKLLPYNSVKEPNFSDFR